MSIQPIKEISIHSHSLPLKVGFPRLSFARMPYRPIVNGGRHVVSKTQHHLWCLMPSGFSLQQSGTVINTSSILGCNFIQQLGVFFILGGLFAWGRLGFYNTYLTWSILKAGSQQCPECLGISSIHYTLPPISTLIPWKCPWLI